MEEKYLKELEREEEKEYNKLGDLLIKLSVAEIYFGDRVNVWISGEEAPELATALEDGAEVAEVLNQIKSKFPTQIMIWVRMEDDYGSAYYLMPWFLAYHGSTQFVLHECTNCGSRLGTARICDSKEPWNCCHGEYVYCALCGAESGLVGAIHGPHGIELTEEEVDLLLQFFKKT